MIVDRRDSRHTTRSAGLRLDFWRSGESIGASKPVVTNRLEPGFNLAFTLQDLYPEISLRTEYAMQLHGYMALPNTSTSLQLVHAAGQATLHIGHCLFQVSDASGSGSATLTRGTQAVLSSLTDGRMLHIQITLTYAASKLHAPVPPYLDTYSGRTAELTGCFCCPI